MTRPGLAYVISIGSNIEPEYHYPAGLRALAQAFTLLGASSTYLAPAVGAPETPAYWNGAARITTPLPPAAIRERLRKIEADAGRVRTTDPNAPRTLDLDLLCAHEENHILAEPPPDPDLPRYHHLLHPAAELLPHAIHPDLLVTLAALRDALGPPPDGFRRR